MGVELLLSEDELGGVGVGGAIPGWIGLILALFFLIFLAFIIGVGGGSIDHFFIVEGFLFIHPCLEGRGCFLL